MMGMNQCSLENRVVLKMGVLKTAWRTIARNPEEAAISRDEFYAYLQRMAGKKLRILKIIPESPRIRHTHQSPQSR